MFQTLSANRLLLLSILVLTCELSGCATTTKVGSGASLPEAMVPPEGRSLLYVYNNASSLDTVLRNIKFMLEFVRPKAHRVGEMTNDNFYVFEIWPGDYTLKKQVPYRKMFGFIGTKGFESSKVKVNVDKPNTVYALSFNSNGTTTYSLWEQQAANISGRNMAGFYPAEENSYARRLGGGATWDGPSKNGIYQHGVGVATFRNGAVFRGRMDNGDMTTDGRLEYPNGRFYIGEYETINNTPNGMGLLADEDGNVVFSGKFNRGTPYGEGASVKDGQVTFSQYNFEGVKMESVPKVLAEREVRRRDEFALKHVANNTEKIASKITNLENIQSSLRTGFEDRESTFSEWCHCTFNICLTALHPSDSYEEKQARKRAGEKQDRECREWRRSGGSSAERREKFERSLASNEQKLKYLLGEYQKAEKRDMEAKKRKAAEQQASRDARIAEMQKQIEERQSQQLDEQRKACADKVYSCGCYAFRPPRGPNESLTCEK